MRQYLRKARGIASIWLERSEWTESRMNTKFNKHKLGWTSLLFVKVDKKKRKEEKKNQHGHFVLIKTRQNGHERFSMMLRTLTSIYKLGPVHCGSQRNNRLRSLHPSRGGEWKGPSTGGIVNDRTWIEPSKKKKVGIASDRTRRCGGAAKTKPATEKPYRGLRGTPSQSWGRGFVGLVDGLCCILQLREAILCWRSL